jgi:hypothetical protein
LVVARIDDAADAARELLPRHAVGSLDALSDRVSPQIADMQRIMTITVSEAPARFEATSPRLLLVVFECTVARKPFSTAPESVTWLAGTLRLAQLLRSTCAGRYDGQYEQCRTHAREGNAAALHRQSGAGRTELICRARRGR